MSRTLCWTIAAGLLVIACGPSASMRAEDLKPIPETPAHSDEAAVTETRICLQYWWMDWGTYMSYYALEHTVEGETCDQGDAINYDGPNDVTPPSQVCDNDDCIAALHAGTEQSGAKAPGVSAREGHGHQSGTRLPAAMNAFHTNRSFYNRHCQEGYRVDGRETSHALYRFDVVDVDDNEATINVVARRIRMIWRGPDVRPANWPESHFEYVGQQVTSDASENGRPGGSSRFVNVSDVGGEVERIDAHIVHLKIPQDDGSWWIYQIVTATPIDRIK